MGIDMLFVVGGNGGNAGAAAIQAELLKNSIVCGVIGVPKSIDNDILLVRNVQHRCCAGLALRFFFYIFCVPIEVLTLTRAAMRPRVCFSRFLGRAFSVWESLFSSMCLLLLYLSALLLSLSPCSRWFFALCVC